MMVGPNNPALSSVQSVVYLFYNDAFVTNDKGTAAGIAVLLMTVLLIITAVQFRLQRRWVTYDY
jgi:multiple sugar transport system permease protein